MYRRKDSEGVPCLLVLSAVLRHSSRLRKIRVMIIIAVFDHWISRAMRKLVFEVAAGIVAGRLRLHRPFFRIAVVMILHKLFF